MIGGGRVTLAGGTFEGRNWGGESKVVLKGSQLVRQAWHRDRIRFRVPEDARSGVVTVECAQLAGAPLLQVNNPYRSDERRGAAEEGSDPIRRRVEPTKMERRNLAAVEDQRRRRRPRKGDRKSRLAAQNHLLHRTDRNGQGRQLRYGEASVCCVSPTPKFGQGLESDAIDEDLEAIKKAARVERPTKIELDAYTDLQRSESRNLNLALLEARRVRAALLSQREGAHRSQRPVAVEELAYGETCPLDRVPGHHPRNRHVDVFVLGEGVIVKHPKACRSGDQKKL